MKTLVKKEESLVQTKYTLQKNKFEPTKCSSPFSPNHVKSILTNKSIDPILQKTVATEGDVKKNSSYIQTDVSTNKKQNCLNLFRASSNKNLSTINLKDINNLNSFEKSFNKSQIKNQNKSNFNINGIYKDDQDERSKYLIFLIIRKNEKYYLQCP